MTIKLQVGNFYRTVSGSLVCITRKLKNNNLSGKVTTFPENKEQYTAIFNTEGRFIESFDDFCEDILYEEPQVGDYVYFSDDFEKCLGYKNGKDKTFLSKISHIDYTLDYPYNVVSAFHARWRFAIKATDDIKSPTDEGVLDIHEVVDYIKKHGNTEGLEVKTSGSSTFYECTGTDSTIIDVLNVYRLAKKKNDPNDPTTWEEGVPVFCALSPFDENSIWVLDTFVLYDESKLFEFVCENYSSSHAKLATQEQIDEWNKLQMELR